MSIAEPAVSITPLLKRLWQETQATAPTAADIAAALSLVFSNRLSDVQTGALLTCLHFTGRDRQADVLMRCAEAMRNQAAAVDVGAVRSVVESRAVQQGGYRGGLCDIVGTGGDSHNTFNVSTTASILASAHVLVAKHGNRASTSRSGSADVLACAGRRPPRLDAITPDTVAALYRRTKYAFLFAPSFHPGARHAAAVRKQLGWRTIFNLLGPLANPLHELIEARVVGVARRDLGPPFAEALRQSGVRKAMVVCGDEELDELSCAGPTHCWRLRERETGVAVEYFSLCPADFGFPTHPLRAVAPGGSPEENGEMLLRLLSNGLPHDDPVLRFVLINAAALLVIAGVCDADGDDGGVVTETGPGGGRWKEGARRARWAVESGASQREWDKFVDATATN